MRRLAPARPRRRGDDELLPLINVVFLLLIFFMVAGRLSATDTFAVEPPQAARGDVAGAPALTVYVSADGRLAVDADMVDLADIADAVRRRVAEAPGTAAAPVRIKADGGADAGRVVAVTEQLRDAGIARVRIMAVPGRAP